MYVILLTLCKSILQLTVTHDLYLQNCITWYYLYLCLLSPGDTDLSLLYEPDLSLLLLGAELDLSLSLLLPPEADLSRSLLLGADSDLSLFLSYLSLLSPDLSRRRLLRSRKSSRSYSFLLTRSSSSCLMKKSLAFFLETLSSDELSELWRFLRLSLSRFLPLLSSTLLCLFFLLLLSSLESDRSLFTFLSPDFFLFFLSLFFLLSSSSESLLSLSLSLLLLLLSELELLPESPFSPKKRNISTFDLRIIY